MRFYLGSHHASQRWFDLEVPLFVSRRVFLAKNRGRIAEAALETAKTLDHSILAKAQVEEEAAARTLRKTLPKARTGWALDSGGFTELTLFGEWRTTPAEYVRDVARLELEVGHLEWVAPQDWMCEPFMLQKTGLSISEHQALTVANFVDLRHQLGRLVIPALQGWTLEDYRRCWDLYDRAGVDLQAEPLVGLGSVCRRQNTAEAGLIVRSLAPALRLHYFGAKITGLERFGDVLASADSMAWSYDGRRLKKPCPEGKKSCANCVHHALAWRSQLMLLLAQGRLEIAA